MTATDPRQELAALAEALRVYVERCQATGAAGLPRATPEDLAARPHAEAAAGAPSTRTIPRERPAPSPEQAAAVPPAAVRPTGGASDAPPSRAREIEESPEVPGGVPATPQAAGPGEAARARLTVLAGEVSGCTRCPLHVERTQAVFARGMGSSGVCFVGEGPGADEDAQGYPFVGKAGQLLDKMIGAMGLGRDEVYICNIVKCRPPKNRKPEPDEVAACRPFLMEQLELVDPKVIVALGATAVEGLLGVTGGITRLRGTWRLYRGRIAVMPTFHPAYLLRSPEAKREVWSDLQEVMKHLGRPVPKK